MKRKKFIAYLNKQNCHLFREDGSHSVFVNSISKKVSTVPRHNEINDYLVVKICKDLEIPKP